MRRRSRRCSETARKTHSERAPSLRTHTSSRACCTARPQWRVQAQMHSIARSCPSSRARCIHVRSSSRSVVGAPSVASSIVSGRPSSPASSRCHTRRQGPGSLREIPHRRSCDEHKLYVNVRCKRRATLDQRHRHRYQECSSIPRSWVLTLFCLGKYTIWVQMGVHL